MVARAVGRETAMAGVDAAAAEGSASIHEMQGLREGTQLSVEKVLKYRGAEGERDLRQKAAEWAVCAFPCICSLASSTAVRSN